MCIRDSITVFVCIVITKRGQIGWSDASLGALVAAWPNTGFMGVPMLATLLGTASVGPVMLTMLIDVFVTSTLCVGLSRLDSSGLDSMGRAFRQALTRSASNPMPWAILFGILVSVFDLELWMPVDMTINMLADAATPTALFTIGAMLARSKMNSTSPDAGLVLPARCHDKTVYPSFVALVYRNACTFFGTFY